MRAISSGRATSHLALIDPDDVDVVAEQALRLQQWRAGESQSRRFMPDDHKARGGLRPAFDLCEFASAALQ